MRAVIAPWSPRRSNGGCHADQLASLHLKNILSFKDTKLDLRPLNVLIGANGSGKSNLIEVLLIDSEGEALPVLTARVVSQIGRVNYPFFMVQLMEARFLADRPTLADY